MSAYITVTVMTDSIERFLNMCRHKNIGFWKISETEQGFTANITREDFFQLKDICRKTKTTVRISKRHGIRFYCSGTVGILLFLSALPRHVLFYTAAACMSGIFHLRVITDIPTAVFANILRDRVFIQGCRYGQWIVTVLKRHLEMIIPILRGYRLKSAAHG